VQDKAGGIAEALSLCENFAGNDPFVVILGDNIFGEPIELIIPENMDTVLFLKSVEDPSRFGVAEVDHLKVLINIEEKPENPKSNLAITGTYIYNKNVWSVLKQINRSSRGELEISDVNRFLLQRYKVHTKEISGWWSDAGTQSSYAKANREIETNLNNQLNEIINKMISS